MAVSYVNALLNDLKIPVREPDEVRKVVQRVLSGLQLL